MLCRSEGAAEHFEVFRVRPHALGKPGRYNYVADILTMVGGRHNVILPSLSSGLMDRLLHFLKAMGDGALEKVKHPRREIGGIP